MSTLLVRPNYRCSYWYLSPLDAAVAVMSRLLPVREVTSLASTTPPNPDRCSGEHPDPGRKTSQIVGGQPRLSGQVLTGATSLRWRASRLTTASTGFGYIR